MISSTTHWLLDTSYLFASLLIRDFEAFQRDLISVQVHDLFEFGELRSGDRVVHFSLYSFID